MPYIENTPADQQTMLEVIGVDSLDQLFDDIPPSMRYQRPLPVPPALSELELQRELSGLAGRNLSVDNCVSFLGGGSYDHFIPAAVDALASRGEFFTAYTPYQAEASQGSLQAFFEFQTLICQLTGMEVSNASLYDGGSAVAEAVLMALTVTRRRKIVVSGAVHPEVQQILATYLENIDCELVTVACTDGITDVAAAGAAVDDQTAVLVVQHPNFWGCLEPMAALVETAHQAGALVCQCFDPISLGVLRRPGQWDVDIAVAEGQSLGTPVSFGGPYLGILACRQRDVRRMPGRLVGETVDRQGKRAFVLTLQTREQHIRRAKATSNICTNQGLLALRASIYLALMGPQGLREAATLCTQKAHYAAERITALPGFERAFSAPFFKEFVVRCPVAVADLVQRALEQGILAGVPLGRFTPDWSDCLLISVTEKRTQAEIDRLVGIFAEAAA